MLLQIILFCMIFVTYGKHEHLKKSIYSHRDNVAAPILAYPDNRMCDKRCNNKYYGASDSPYCCGRGDTTGTYYCCQYSTCCDGSYCCAPGHNTWRHLCLLFITPLDPVDATGLQVECQAFREALFDLLEPLVGLCL